MTTYYDKIQQLCEANSIQYHFGNDNKVLINDTFWFVIKNDDISNIITYIDIISGKNEIVNIICDKF